MEKRFFSESQIDALSHKYYNALGIKDFGMLKGQPFNVKLRNKVFSHIYNAISYTNSLKQCQWIARDMIVNKLCDMSSDQEYYYYSKDMLAYFVKECDRQRFYIKNWQVKNIKDAYINWGKLAQEKFEDPSAPLMYNWCIPPLAQLFRFAESRLSESETTEIFVNICDEIDEIGQDGDLFFDEYDKVVCREEQGITNIFNYVGANIRSSKMDIVEGSKAGTCETIDLDKPNPTGQGDGEE